MKPVKFLIAGCVVWYIFLCFFHYFSLRPLWLDERSVLENIRGLNPQEIFGPLKNCQIFPRLYLFVIKFFSQIFAHQVMALRFLPFLSMLLAFLVWSKLYRKVFSDSWQYALILFAWASSYHFSYFAAELKPYSMDVLVMGIFCLYLAYQKERLAKNNLSLAFIFLTLLLPFTILVSYSSLFVFWIVGYNLLFADRNKPRFLILAAAYFLFSISLVLFVFNTDLKNVLSATCVISYWNDYFLCTGSFYCFIKSLGEGLRRLSVWWWGNTVSLKRFASFLIPIFIPSLFYFGLQGFKKDKLRLFDMGALGGIVFLELFILGLFKKYPFTGERITLFYAPFVFYFVVRGIAYTKKYKILYYSITILLIVLFLACNINNFWEYKKLYV